jgi:hypothetical protein
MPMYDGPPPLQPMARGSSGGAAAAMGLTPPQQQQQHQQEQQRQAKLAHQRDVRLAQQLEERIALMTARKLAREDATAMAAGGGHAAAAAAAPSPTTTSGGIPATLMAAMVETGGLQRLPLQRQYSSLLLYANMPFQKAKIERKIQTLIARAKRSNAAMGAAMGSGGFTSAAHMANGTGAGGAAAASASSAAAAAAGGAAAAAASAPKTDDVDPDAANFQTEAASAVVFQAYQCRSLKYGVMHPCEVTEAGTLSGVDLPPARYPLQRSMPPNIIRDGLLSSLQLEGVVYASQRMQQILHDGTRAGFFLADGAGVGST